VRGRRVAALQFALHLSVHVVEHRRLFPRRLQVVRHFAYPELLRFDLDDRACFFREQPVVEPLQGLGLLRELLLDVVEPARAASAVRTSAFSGRPASCRGP
jgi:hypothetical protein